MEKNYETTDKVITRMAVYDELPKDCDDAMVLWDKFDHDFYRWRWRENIQYSKGTNLFKWLLENPKALEWAVEVGFLREVEPEVLYESGDFIRNPHGEIYQIRCIGDSEKPHAGLISTKYRGDWHGQCVVVKNREEITHKDIVKMIDGRWRNFSRVEKKDELHFCPTGK